MSNIDDLIKSCEDNYPLTSDAARAELAQLHATVAAQAEQLETAREILDNIFNHDWLSANAPQQAQAEQPVSAVELAAYRFYLGDTSDRLCELFEDMPTDERERYRKANTLQADGHVHLSANGKCVICGLSQTPEEQSA